ncbi:MAG: hypothetical protein WC593_08210 [Methanoregula sp.]
MTEERDIEEDLKPNFGDYAHAGVRAGLSTAPFVGGPLAEFFAMVIAPPLEKRRDAWLIEIFTRLKKLEEEIDGFKIENLTTNENFISTLFYATQIAMRTHQQEKLEALRNAVINSISIPTIDENLQLIFLNLIDRYTPWHLVILQFLDNPHQYGESHGIKYPNPTSFDNLRTVIELTFPELNKKQEFYDQIVKEMISDGLLQQPKKPNPYDSGEMKVTEINLGGFLPPGNILWQGMFASRTTEMGKQFLEFISDPIGSQMKKR